MASTRIAVVTGTARKAGIGRAVARAFVKQSYKVLGVDRLRPEALEDEDGAFHDAYRHLVVDISQQSEINFLSQEVQKQFGAEARVDVLVNNAGVADPHLPQNDVELVERFNKILAVNLSGAFMVTQALLPNLAPGASIIHISSTRALQSEPHTEAYAAAKAGLLGLTHAQAISLAGTARVNAVLPGWIDTSGDPASLRSEDHQWHPAGRVGVPEDIAEICLFLGDSSKSGFITGQQFVVDGGVTRKMVYPE